MIDIVNHFWPASPALPKLPSPAMVLSRKVLAFMLLTLPPTAVSALTYFVGGASGIAAVGVGALSSFAFCDFWYFLRMGLHALTPAPRGPRKHLFAVSKVKGRIGLMDIDRNGHCNNARFLRECGFGPQWRVEGGDCGRRQPRGGLADRALPTRAVLRAGLYDAVATHLLGQARLLRGAPIRDPRHQGRLRKRHRTSEEHSAGRLSPAQIVAKLPALQSDEEATPPCPRTYRPGSRATTPPARYFAPRSLREGDAAEGAMTRRHDASLF
ncbi:hypothetical protein GQ600_15059 [Phytophthora cactorum]|nr:hypothetical protein GQ600_15059 [Phytophthora cactorum]